MAKNAKESRIALAYAEIQKAIETESYSKVLKAANKVLNDDHSQAEAWQCRVVASIHLGSFTDAIKAIERAPNSNAMQFELAYCQYRLNEVRKAHTTLLAAPDRDSPRCKELLAQVLYRLEQYEECNSTYREVVRCADDDLDVERTTNIAAVQVHRCLQGKCEAPARPKPSASYELWYNNACAVAAAGDAVEAAARLNVALDKCKSFLEEEGASEKEIHQDQAIIKVQLGYVLQCCGRDKEATALYTSVLQYPVDDPALLAILHNNVAAANKDTNVFESRKKMKATQVAGLEHKLTSAQRDQLTLNNCIISLASQQQEDAGLLTTCESLVRDGSAGVQAKAVLVLAASLARAGRLEEAVQRLQRWADGNTHGAHLVRLAAAQLKLSKNDANGGADELYKLPPADRYRPGVVASLVVLYTAKKNKAAVSNIYKEAANWHHKNKSGAPADALEAMLRRAADHHLKEGDPQAAALALEQLREICPGAATAVLPALLHAYAQFDANKAKQLSQELPDVPIPEGGADADALEASLGPKFLLKAALKAEEAAEGDVSKSAGGRVKQRKKKKRRTVLPKRYVHGVVPDPDRWLPRWQRRNAGGGGGRRRAARRRDRDVGRGTQGGVGDAADKYDITKNPGLHKSSQQQQQPEAVGPRRNMPKKKNKKK
ncbi:signal recognition particle subunit SRP72 isoform X2 [Hyalella azteca]|uniref:Signal recognition particle subunit SRP72 n=1 Tax=Hyalella azteca TaxID=294128 RepID=A0A8B7NSK7_HYAAZ|nr:signal recognition particle subunit SRP72 isoform X2 [Hyalella azteca]